ncbi:MAG: hypothetical protein ACI8Q2_000563, partial [Candidatus Omnitrophota bacterium]
MLGTLSYFYINRILLPVTFKSFVEDQFTQTLHRKVSIGTIDFKILKGITIKDITIYEEKNPQTPEFAIQSANFNIILSDFISSKTIVIPTIRLKEPTIKVIRHQDNTFNFSDILNKPTNKNTPSSYKLICKTLLISDATIEFTDQVTPFKETIDHLNIRGSISLKKVLTFNIDGNLANNKTTFKTTGEYDISAKRLTSQVNATHLNLDHFAPYIKPLTQISTKNAIVTKTAFALTYAPEALEISGNIDTSHMSFAKDNFSLNGKLKAIGLNLKLQNATLEGRGLIDLSKVSVKKGKHIYISENLKADVDEFQINKDKIKFTSKQFVLKDLSTTFASIKSVRTNITSTNVSFIKNKDTTYIVGDYALNNTKLTVNDNTSYTGNITIDKISYIQTPDKLELTTELETTQTNLILNDQQSITGTLQSDNFNVAIVDNVLAIRSNIKTSNITTHIDKELTFLGSPEILIDLKSPLNNFEKLAYKGHIDFNKSSLGPIPHVGTLKKINGRAVFDVNRVNTTHLKVVHENTNYDITGVVENFKNPTVIAEISSKKLDLKHALKLSTPYVEFLKNNTSFTIDGSSAFTLKFKGNPSKVSDAVITLTTQINDGSIHLTKMAHDITEVNGTIAYDKDAITWKDLSGTFKDTPYTINGQFIKELLPRIINKVTSENISIASEMKLHKSNVDIINISGDIYDSKFDLTGASTYDFKNPIVNLTGNVAFDFTNLTRLKVLPKKLIELDPLGEASIKGSVSGPIKDWRKLKVNLTMHADYLELASFPFFFLDLDVTQEE